MKSIRNLLWPTLLTAGAALTAAAGMSAASAADEATAAADCRRRAGIITGARGIC